MKNIPILIIADTREELDWIQPQVSSDFACCYTATNDDSAMVLFDKHQPQLLIVSCEQLEQAKRFRLNLLRNSKKIHHTLHQSILLCTAADTKDAYELCMGGIFDHYVVTRPDYDFNQLRLSLHHAVARLKLMTVSGGADMRLTPFVEVVGGLHETIRKSIEQGNLARDDAARACYELSTSLMDKIDTLKLLFDEDSVRKIGAIDSECLEERINRFKQESILPELKRTRSRVNKILDVFVGTMQSDYERYKPSVKAFDQIFSQLRRHILVVDDDGLYRDMVKNTLESEGYRVSLASNGTQALSAAVNTNPDLILVDLHMPGINGLEVTRIAKTYDSLKNIPIIMMTGDNHETSRRDAVDSGVVDYIVKPARRGELLEKTARHIDKWTEEREMGKQEYMRMRS